MKYRKVAVGGSFDVLHRGHEALLREAFNAGEFVLIGLTSNDMLKKKVAPFSERKKEVVEFLRNKSQYEIIKLTEPIGPAGSDETIEAIVVSSETTKGADEINKIRKKNDIKKLDILSIPLVLADDGLPISSSRIKNGEIDRDGRPF